MAGTRVPASRQGAGDQVHVVGDGRLSVTLTRHLRVVVATLAGVLDERTAPRARRAVLKALADGPELVVLDVGRLEAPDVATASLFASLAEHVEERLVVAAPSLSIAAALERLTPRRLRVVDTVADAVDAADGALVPRRFRELVPPWPGARWQARRLVDQACATWELGALVDAAREVAAELVDNAVRHAATDAVLTITPTSRYLHIAVRDGSPDEPVLAPPGPGPRQGLRVVAELSTNWGVTGTADGKLVWATLSRLPRPVEPPDAWADADR
jgi:anti-anti-sigma regulatory factor